MEGTCDINRVAYELSHTDAWRIATFSAPPHPAPLARQLQRTCPVSLPTPCPLPNPPIQNPSPYCAARTRQHRLRSTLHLDGVSWPPKMAHGSTSTACVVDPLCVSRLLVAAQNVPTEATVPLVVAGPPCVGSLSWSPERATDRNSALRVETGDEDWG